MKKLSLLLVVFLVLGATAFGQDVDFSVSGDATATFGADLDDGVTGISNSNSADLKWTFVEEASDMAEGEGMVYGWIELANFEATVDSAGLSVTAPSISAKLMLGEAYINLTSTAVDVDAASMVVAPGMSDILTLETLDNTVAPEFEGVALGFGLGPATLDLTLASEYDWIGDDDTTRNNDNAYHFGLDLGLSSGGLSADVYSNLTYRFSVDEYDVLTDPAAAGLSVGYDVTEVAGLTVTPELGTDLVFGLDAAGDMTTDVEVGGGVNAVDGDGNGFGLGATFMLNADETQDLDVKLGFSEASADDGLLPLLGVQAIVNFNIDDLGGDAPVNALGVGLETDATVGDIKPYLGVMAANADLENGDFGATGNFGVDLSMVPNTVFTIDYKSGNLLLDGEGAYDGNEYSTDAALSSVTSKAGVLTVSTTISF